LVPISVHFGGGCELLFEKRNRLPLNVSNGSRVADLIELLCRSHLKGRPELFVQGNTVRPGILVLINDVDWEIVGGLEYSICPNDNILFISTLHGG